MKYEISDKEFLHFMFIASFLTAIVLLSVLIDIFIW